MISDFHAAQKAAKLMDGPRQLSDKEALEIAGRRYWNKQEPAPISDEEALRIAEGRPRRAQLDLTRLIRKFHR